MKFIVFYLEFINTLEGPGMFFSSAAIIRRLRSYAATHEHQVNRYLVMILKAVAEQASLEQNRKQ